MNNNHLDLISSSLDVLCNASNEELQHHRRKVYRTVQRLQNALPPSNHLEPTPPPSDHEDSLQSLSNRHGPALLNHDTSSPSSNRRDSSCPSLENDEAPRPSFHRHNSSAPSSENETIILATLDPNDLPTSTVGELLRQLERHCDEIGRYLRKTPRNAVFGNGTWKQEDFRIVDILVCDRGRKPSLSKFRKCLGERALAKEFGEFEVATYGSSKLAELVKDPAVLVKNDHTTTFVEKKKFVYNEAAKRGIQHGIKLFVIETLLKVKGISALLAFTFNNCWKLRLDEIVSFVGWLQRPRFSNVLDLARSKSAWFSISECLYIGQTTTPIAKQVCINPQTNINSPQPNSTKRTSPSIQPAEKRIRLGVPEGRQWEVSNTEPMNLLAEVATANLNRDPVLPAQRINLEPHTPEELTLLGTVGNNDGINSFEGLLPGGGEYSAPAENNSVAPSGEVYSLSCLCPPLTPPWHHNSPPLVVSTTQGEVDGSSRAGPYLNSQLALNNVENGHLTRTLTQEAFHRSFVNLENTTTGQDASHTDVASLHLPENICPRRSCEVDSFATREPTDVLPPAHPLVPSPASWNPQAAASDLAGSECDPVSLLDLEWNANSRLDLDWNAAPCLDFQWRTLSRMDLELVLSL